MVGHTVEVLVEVVVDVVAVAVDVAGVVGVLIVQEQVAVVVVTGVGAATLDRIGDAVVVVVQIDGIEVGHAVLIPVAAVSEVREVVVIAGVDCDGARVGAPGQHIAVEDAARICDVDDVVAGVEILEVIGPPSRGGLCLQERVAAVEQTVVVFVCIEVHSDAVEGGLGSVLHTVRVKIEPD